MFQSCGHVLQGSGGDMVISTLLGNQPHLQLQTIQLRSHLRQLLFQPSPSAAQILNEQFAKVESNAVHSKYFDGHI